MGAVIKRYFWCDAPSPLHEARERYLQERRAALERAEALAKSVGGVRAVFRYPHMVGVAFMAAPNAAHWKKQGCLDGVHWYAPMRVTKEMRQVGAGMSRVGAPKIESVVEGHGLSRMRAGVEDGRCYMYRTSVAWKDDRIFVVVPTGGEDADESELEVPDFLTECRSWEMDRWFDEGRQPPGGAG